MAYNTLPGPGTLSMTERTLYVLGGLLLAAAGAKPRPNPLLNVAALGIGSYLAWRGAEGSCPAKAALSNLSHGGSHAPQGRIEA